MKVVIFCHSIVSDWNHGNAHFLRGIVAELLDRGHDVQTWEPRDGWSRQNLLRDGGRQAIDAILARFPWMARVAHSYDLAELDLDRALDGADLVLVHEWSDPELVRRVGERRVAGARFRLLFHDTHHRAATAPEQMARFDLSHYDGVLAYGHVIRDIYMERNWAARAWTWHEAADTRVFRPQPDAGPREDLVWIGNWGDDERTAELSEFLLRPARRARMSGSVYGVRYPRHGRFSIRRARLAYRGWLANHMVPRVFGLHRLTVHVPRRPYVEKLPGIPTIRPFEAMACGIPLVSAPWDDAEGLFRPGKDFLFARSGEEMQGQIAEITHDRELARSLRACGLETIAARHTCAHRVTELLDVARELGVSEETHA